MVRLFAVLFLIAAAGGCRHGEADPFESAGQYRQVPFVIPAGDLAAESVTAAGDVSEPNGVLTLKDALSLTLRHNHELKAFSYEVKAAGARQLQAGLWENPELSLDVEDVGGRGPYRGTGSAETTIQLSQLIELGNKAQTRAKVFSYATELADMDYEARRLDICTDLTKTFTELLYVEQKQMLSQDLIATLGHIADSTDRRVQAGKDSALDLSKARAALAKAQVQHQAVEQYKAFLRKKLSSYWGSQSPGRFSPAGSLEQVWAIPSPDELQHLLQSNPDVARWAIEEQKRRAEVASARVRSIPNITVGGGVKQFNETDDTAFVFGLSIGLPIANQNQGERLEASHNLSKATEQKQAAELAAWNELNRLYAHLYNAHRKATAYKNEILPSCREVFGASQISYDEGKIDYLTLLDAQRTYFESQNEYLDALADYHLYRTELERLIGRGLDELNPYPTGMIIPRANAANG